ncbi:histone acetyltransferase type B catalytic subunit [Harmonia axyridis]|uniref:histone acetyltransferase type B catalytic subunit n=1 Tax=Harmonia axyridis TaxID=115357 RepID=UPI001E2787C1|nr:histone acetyltransferase type B catalytic subunit [Harmonia axyridis]
MEEKLSKYKSNALEAVSFTLVISEREVDNPGVCEERCMFQPLLAHQVFGERELIFGYEDPHINLFYHHNSLKCLLDIKYKSKISGFEVDDIPKLMNEWLPRNYFTSKEEYKRMIKNDVKDQMFGTVIHQFKQSNEVFFLDEGEVATCTYKITRVNTQDELFQEYHERFETFIIWFIDAANFINLKDDRWIIFYMYEEVELPGKNEKIISPIGFTAIYKFFSYPDSNRARISQFFILPTHQNKGLGTIFYQTVYSQIMKMPDVTDLTVEEPNELFQKMRDYCDAILIHTDLKKNGRNIASMNNKILYSYFAKHKINRKQSLRLSDILQYVTAIQSGPKQRRHIQDLLYERFKHQKMNEKRVGKMARGSLTNKEEVNEDELHQEIESYISQIEPVADKIVKVLLKAE